MILQVGELIPLHNRATSKLVSNKAEPLTITKTSVQKSNKKTKQTRMYQPISPIRSLGNALMVVKTNSPSTTRMSPSIKPCHTTVHTYRQSWIDILPKGSVNSSKTPCSVLAPESDYENSGLTREPFIIYPFH